MHWYIGIAENKNLHKMSDFAEKVYESYSLKGFGGKYHHGTWIERIDDLRYNRNGDIICMYFNYHEKTLSYSVNKSKFKCIFQDIDTSKKWIMAVSVDSRLQELQLESSQCI